MTTLRKISILSTVKPISLCLLCHGEGQDDLAILVPLVGAAKQVADAPDEAGDLGVSLGGHGVVGLILLDLHCGDKPNRADKPTDDVERPSEGFGIGEVSFGRYFFNVSWA